MTRPTTPAPDAAAPDVLAAVMVRVTIDGGEWLYLIAQSCPQADGATRWSVEGCGSHTTPRGAALMACVSRKLAAIEVYVPGQYSPAADLARLRAPADLAAIGARAAAATPGPWRTGRSYTRMGANDGGEWLRGTYVINYPPGRCSRCRREAEPCALTEVCDGRTFHINASDDPEAWVEVTSDATRDLITGVDNDDQGGVMVRADAEFIAHARTDVPALLALLAAEREGHAAEVAGARAAALREAGDVARAEMALWADALDSGSEVAIARHRTASDIVAAIAALGAKGGG